MSELDRRDLLVRAGLLALAPLASCRSGAGRAQRGVWLNDVHSQLNATRVARVVEVDSLASLTAAVRTAAREGLAVSVAGGRHAMGGQQFGTDALHLDTRAMDRVIRFDRERGLIEVEAGIQWPALVAHYLAAQPGDERPFGLVQKQTGADRLSIGGALSANAHGRGLALQPLVGDVEAFTLVDARGQLRECSREVNAELFALAAGGYGLFGALHSVTLRLARRTLLERVVELRGADGLMEAFDGRIRDGYLYGDFQFAIDPGAPEFLREGVFSCYRPVEGSGRAVPEGQRELADAQWAELVHLAHAAPSEAYRRYSEYYLGTSGQLYWSDTQQLGFYADDYHAALDRRLGSQVRGSEMITELYVPRAELTGFLVDAAAFLREERTTVVYGTVRLIERDDTTVLAWAREAWACTVMNLHVDHDADGIERARRAFRGLIDLARARGGSYFLTYHRWATREQVEACHPRFRELLASKLEHDPDERFQSDWYRHHRDLLTRDG